MLLSQDMVTLSSYFVEQLKNLWPQGYVELMVIKQKNTKSERHKKSILKKKRRNLKKKQKVGQRMYIFFWKQMKANRRKIRKTMFFALEK